MESENNPKKIGYFALTMISSAIVISIRNLPTLAMTGMHMIFFALVAAIFYFIPVAAVSAELATGWPKSGGIYAWIKEAFGGRWGFFAIWLQWTYMVLVVIAIVYFTAGSVAYLFDPALTNNKLFLLAVAWIVIWLFTFLNLRGLKASSAISTIGFLSGILIPGLLIIVLGIIYLFQHQTIHLDMSFTFSNLFPDLTSFGNVVLLVGFMMAFSGVEVSSAHASKVVNPRRNYPLAILSVVVICLFVIVIGSLSVAIVVPKEEISLIGGVMEAFTVFFSFFNLKWLMPYLAIMVALGQMGGVSTWLNGPVKGLLGAAYTGDLPRFFQRVNQRGAPRNLLLVQGAVISILASFILLLPNVNIAFWFAVALSMIIYVTMYFLMFLAGIYLRYKKPDEPRAFRIIGKKNIGMWIVAVIGMIATLFTFFIAFFPPSDLPSGGNVAYVVSLIIGAGVIFVIPPIIEKFKKESWAHDVEKAEPPQPPKENK